MKTVTMYEAEDGNWVELPDLMSYARDSAKREA